MSLSVDDSADRDVILDSLLGDTRRGMAPPPEQPQSRFASAVAFKSSRQMDEIIADVLLGFISLVTALFFTWISYGTQFASSSPDVVWIGILWGLIIFASAGLWWVTQSMARRSTKAKGLVKWAAGLLFWSSFIFMNHFISQPVDASLTSSGWANTLSMHRTGLAGIPFVIIQFV